MDSLDSFALHTRYRPGLQAVAPLIIAAMAIGIDKIPIVVSLVSFAAAIGLPIRLAHTVRQRGRNVEPDLWESWGGKPTTRMLRLADTFTPEGDKLRWRSTLGGAAKVSLPDLEQELADRAGADVLYEQVTGYAREATRNDRLLLAENRAYNVERNQYALRPVALPLAIVGVVVMVIAGVVQSLGSGPLTPVAVGLAANTGMLGLWVSKSDSRVRLMADTYAVRLFTVATNQLVAADS
jgi:hypothetical protein